MVSQTRHDFGYKPLRSWAVCRSMVRLCQMLLWRRIVLDYKARGFARKGNLCHVESSSTTSSASRGSSAQCVMGIATWCKDQINIIANTLAAGRRSWPLPSFVRTDPIREGNAR
jgi:hypothetical protein